MKHSVGVTDKYESEKETATMKKSLRNKRLKSLEKGKAHALGFFEILSMKFAGWTDGRKGLLRKSEDGTWLSSRLKEEVDSYEEFCGNLYGRLKVEEEEEFKKLNTLFDGVTPMYTSLSDAQKHLRLVLDKKIVLNERKVGEEDLTEAQVIARRSRERDKQLQPFYDDVEKKKKALSERTDEIFERLSRIKESFDSTCKIANRLLQHSHRRIDVYWRSAMRQNGELPPVPNIRFTKFSEQEYRKHYEALAGRVELLSKEFVSEV